MTTANMAEAPLRSGTRHPLDPLDGAELAAVAAAVRGSGQIGARARFVCVELREPHKSALEAWRGGAVLEREARVVLLDPADGLAHEALVAVEAGSVLSLEAVPGVQAAITAEEFAEAEPAIKADPVYLAALARRGIDDVELVMIDSWSVGLFEEPGRRVARALSWLRSDLTGDNGYARPIGGLVAVVDLLRMEVVRIDDHGVVPIAPEHGNYTEAATGPARSDLRPIAITQPEGASFAVEGWAVRWGPWRFRVGYTPREALVLHELAFEHGGRVRPVAHRASIAELVIPYGGAQPEASFKNAFDIGEYGIGPYVNALERGCDCLGEIQYLDVELAAGTGEVQRFPNAVCMHEEDHGILWKHYDWRSNTTEVRRARRMVVSSIVTVGNYEYGLFWYLYLDGSIEFETKLTGVLHTVAVEPGADAPHATVVAPGVAAPYHQHFLCARLDLDVDGVANALVEVEAVADPVGPDNPHGHAFSSAARPLRSEREAVRSVSPLTARRWQVRNPDVRNRMGAPVAYELVPGDTVAPCARPDSEFVRRAGFVESSLWATPYVPDERYPAGEYPNQHAGGDGLPRWTAADRSLDGEDVVLWYVFGAHHVPRLEDWPVMPVARAGFSLRPVGFFDRNPALDVPAPQGCSHS